MTPWRAGALLLALIAFPLLAAARLQADEPNRAAVVVRAGDELIESRCVAFTEESLSGYELLSRSGLDHIVNPTGAGVMVCSIVGEGCPANNCLCQCQGEPCTYWSYWRWGNEGWQYAGLGASVTQIGDGDIDGWSWGPGSVTSAIEPPAVDFAEVCRDVVAPAATGASAAEPARAWLPYALFLLFAALLGGAFVLLQRRKPT